MGIRSLGLWRKTRLCTMSATVNFTAFCCYLKSGSVAREQLQQRNVERLSCTVPSLGGNARTGGKKLGVVGCL